MVRPDNETALLGEKLINFFQAVKSSRAVSHVGIIACKNDVGYQEVEIYTLTTFPLDQQHIDGRTVTGKRLDRLYSAVLEHITDLDRPPLFFSHWLVDSARYTPESFKTELEKECVGREKFEARVIGFDSIDRLLEQMRIENATFSPAK